MTAYRDDAESRIAALEAENAKLREKLSDRKARWAVKVKATLFRWVRIMRWTALILLVATVVVFGTRRLFQFLANVRETSRQVEIGNEKVAREAAHYWAAQMKYDVMGVSCLSIFSSDDFDCIISTRTLPPIRLRCNGNCTLF